MNFRLPTSWSPEYHHWCHVSSRLGLSPYRGGGWQLITSGGHFCQVPAVTKTGLLSANRPSAWPWTSNGFLLGFDHATDATFGQMCVYVYVYYMYVCYPYHIWRLVEMFFSQNRAKLLFRWGPAIWFIEWSALSCLVGTRKSFFFRDNPGLLWRTSRY